MPARDVGAERRTVRAEGGSGGQLQLIGALLRA